MAFILLDNDFYEEIEDDGYIDKLINFIEYFFNLDISIFFPSYSTEYSWAEQNMLAVIRRKILKTGKYEILDSSLVTPSTDSSYDQLHFSEEFIGQINYLLENNNDVVIPVVPNKHKLNIKLPKDNVFIINHIYCELESNISHFIQNEIFMQNIQSPTLSAPLPNKELCKDYYTVQKNMIAERNDKYGTYSKVAKEVAGRNKYIYNKAISLKNKPKSKKADRKKREIYNFNKKQYISTDFESGCFETYNSSGKHQGEFSYINDRISPPDKTGKHDIII